MLIMSNRINTLIAADVIIDGDISFSGGLRVDGCIRGNVLQKGSQPGFFVLSERARVEGSVVVSRAMIYGTVLGLVQADSYVELHGGARVAGGLQYTAMEIHSGAIVEGEVLHTADPEKLRPG